MSIIEETIAKLKLTDLQSTSKVASQELPALKESEVLEIVELLKDVEGNNGFLAIAQTVGTSLDKVKEVQTARLSKISELTPSEEE